MKEQRQWSPLLQIALLTDYLIRQSWPRECEGQLLPRLQEYDQVLLGHLCPIQTCRVKRIRVGRGLKHGQLENSLS